MISLVTVRLVAAKELRESIRDRRTLFVALLLPVLLYPMMMLGIAPLVNLQREKLREEAQPIAVTGEDAAALQRLVLVPDEDPKETQPVELAVVASKEPRKDLIEGRVALWVEVASDFAKSLGSERTARVTIHQDGSDDRSLAAAKKFQVALAKAQEREVARRVAARGLPPGLLKPVDPVMVDVAPPERRAAYVFGKLLAFVLVILTLSSSFYPAVDSVAGEKERGTMETLLVAPCGRAELVLGKFVAVLAVTLTAATLNLASMSLTLGPLGGVIAPDLGAGLRVTPQVILGVLALLVPLAALFSAIALMLSTLARTVKEGQHYLTPLFVVIMPLTMVVVLPNVPLTSALAPLPVTNAVLFFRDLLLGKAEPGTTAVVLVSTFVYAGLALWACVSLFLREETLFRGPEGGTRLLARPARRETPGGAAALFLFGAAMAAAWYGQSLLPKTVVENVIVTQLALLLVPSVLLTSWIRARFRSTYLVRGARPLQLAAAVLIGFAAPVVNLALSKLIGVEPSGPLREIGRQLSEYVRDHALVAVLLFGVLPAAVEECFFRGFVLSGLRSAFRGRGAAVRAVIVSAALFALFHIFPEKWGPTFLMGLLLGGIAVRTGSIWPGMLVHALNNSLLVLSETGLFGEVPDRATEPVGIAVAVTVLAAGVFLLVRTRNTRRLP